MPITPHSRDRVVAHRALERVIPERVVREALTSLGQTPRRESAPREHRYRVPLVVPLSRRVPTDSADW